ncbi:MAG: tetratricopeptide repeat protein [Clostridia bacterium]|nr:tetratricopeptide repeat protein [Clostridia bacterium]
MTAVICVAVFIGAVLSAVVFHGSLLFSIIAAVLAAAVFVGDRLLYNGTLAKRLMPLAAAVIACGCLFIPSDTSDYGYRDYRKMMDSYTDALGAEKYEKALERKLALEEKYGEDDEMRFISAMDASYAGRVGEAELVRESFSDKQNPQYYVLTEVLTLQKYVSDDEITSELLSVWTEAADMYPDWVYANKAAGGLLLAENEYEKAIYYLTRALTEDNDDDSQIYYYLGAALVKNGQYEDGLKLLNHAYESGVDEEQTSELLWYIKTAQERVKQDSVNHDNNSDNDSSDDAQDKQTEDSAQTADTPRLGVRIKPIFPRTAGIKMTGALNPGAWYLIEQADWAGNSIILDNVVPDDPKNPYVKCIKNDFNKVWKARSLYKGNAIFNQYAQNKFIGWYNNKYVQPFTDGYEAIKTHRPVNVAKRRLWKQNKKNLKNAAKVNTGRGAKIAKGVGMGVDAGFAIYGFYDMYKNPTVGFKSPTLELCGNSLRGMSATASFAYNFWKNPNNALVSVGYTAVDTAFNSDTMVNFMNEHVPSLGIVDDITNWVNKAWQAAFTWVFFTERPDMLATADYNEKALKKLLDGTTFQGNGIGVYKPNIYLYPNKTTDFTVTFEQPELLTVTDPIYNGQWSGTAKDSGVLTVDGEEYGYLFYESETNPNFFVRDEGFVIPYDSRKETFEKTLRAYGLNDTEIADFCEFWCDKLDEGEDYAMYPHETSEVDAAMAVDVSPVPDSVLRLWFGFIKDDVPYKEPDISEFTRDGFTVVEWGGYIMNETAD